MRLFACVKMDMREGFLESRKRLFLVVLVSLVIIGFALLGVEAARMGMEGESTVSAFSLGETLTACFGGIREFDRERDLFFQFPAAWILMLASIAYVTLSYPYRDLMGFGRSVLIASGSRRDWWVAKCAWVVASALLCCLLVMGSCALMTLVGGGALGLTVGGDAFGALLHFPPDSETPLEIAPFVMVLPCVVASLCLMQMALSLVAGPVLSFGATMALLLWSAYFFNPALLGNYLMVARTGVAVSNGTDPCAGLALALGTGLVSVLLGGLYFSRMDCVDKEVSL